VPLVRVQNIRSGFLNYNNMVFISDDEHLKYKKTELNEGDLVLSKVGTIGEVAIVSERDNKCNFSQNTIGIKINKKKIKSEYLLLYLISNLGQLQLQRNQMFQVQSKLELEDIRDLKVVLLNEAKQDGLRKIVAKIIDLRESSEMIYSQAEQILLEGLGLKDLDLKDDLFYTTTLKEVKDNNRMDTEYYMPKYDYILKAIKKKGYNRLDSISKFSKILLKKKSEIFYKYIEIGGIDVSTGDVTYKEMQGCELPTNAKLKVSGGELIISKVRPTRGAIAIVPDYLTNNYLCSGAFSIFKIKSPIREYIQVFLRSKIGKVLLGHASTGTQYPTITDEDVKVIPIPDLSKNVMENISNKVFSAHVKRESAKALLEQAKHKVEDMIEKEAGLNNGI